MIHLIVSGSMGTDMDMDMSMEISNYNEPVNIVLPDEAEDADEFWF